MAINKVMVTGNLTRNPELRRTQSGTSILEIGVAVNDRRKNQQTGEWQDYANFVDCKLFGKRAESLASILAKGMKVAIEGKLNWSQWERDGQKRSKLDVIVDDIEFMAPRQQQPQGGYAQPQPPQQQGNYYAAQQPVQAVAYAQQPVQESTNSQFAVYDDDIPF